MPKIGNKKITIDGRDILLEIHYNAKRDQFFVKIDQHILDITGFDPHEDTRAEAEKRAEFIHRAYIKSVSTNRMMICIYAPDKSHRRHFNINTFEIPYVTLDFGYKLLEEITVEGDKRYKDQRGNFVWLPGIKDDFLIIEWTQEREDFFKRSLEALQQAKDKIRSFCEAVVDNPELINGAANLLLPS